MKTPFVKSLFLFIVLFVFASKTAFCQYDSLKPKGIYTSNFIIDEIPRDLTYYMPQNYGKLEVYPLLIVLHDKESSAMNVIKKWGDLIHAKADSADCVVMYPDAVDGIWKNGKNKDSLNDRMFISIMINFFVQQYHCDAARVYLLGIGAGSNVAYQLGCEKNSKINALALIRSINTKTDSPVCASATTPVANFTNEGNGKAAVGKGCDFLLSHK